MKKGAFISLICLSFTVLGACSGEPNSAVQAPSGATADAPNSQNWNELIVDARREADVPAMGGVIMKNGVILNQGFVGKKNYFADEKITSTDVWHVGSITKSMTATMIARLVERGALNWNATIQDIFGSEGIHADWHDVTLTELLTHSSGAAANFSTEIMLNYPSTEDDTRLARREAVADILAVAPNEKSTFVYSNVGFTIAGHIAEHKTGKSWEALMRDEVFGPLDLQSAGFGAPQPRGDIAPIRGHRGKLSMDPSGLADNSPIIGPAGTVHMSLQDLAKFGGAHLNGLKGETTYLTQETFEILHAANLNDYAMGWIEVEPKTLPAETIFWHNGSNTMWYALLLAVPEENLVYALAANTGTIEKIDPVFNALIKQHLTELKKTEIE